MNASVCENEWMNASVSESHMMGPVPCFRNRKLEWGVFV